MIQNHVWCDLPQQEAFSLFSKKIFQRVATLSTSPCLQKSYLPYDLAILLWGIYPKEMKMGCWKDICILMFIAALLIIAKIWKQPKCPSVDEWINKMWYIYIYIYIYIYTHNGLLFGHKKEGNPTTYNNMDGPWGHYTKWESQNERNKFYMISIIGGILKSQLAESESRMVVTRGWGVWEWSRCSLRVWTCNQ